MAYSVRDIARNIGVDIVGNGDVNITHVTDLENATVGSLSFAVSRQYVKTTPINPGKCRHCACGFSCALRHGCIG